MVGPAGAQHARPRHRAAARPPRGATARARHRSRDPLPDLRPRAGRARRRRRSACRWRARSTRSTRRRSRDHRETLTPVGIIPMHTPEEAIAELDHATGELGLKAFMFGGPISRPAPGVDPPSRAARWLDSLGLDSLYDYDPVWQRCVELGVSPTFHTAAMGWTIRASVSNYVFNHIGMFAIAGEMLALSLFMGGVPQRFPQLRFAFQEGGVAWAAALLCEPRRALGEAQPRRGRALQPGAPRPRAGGVVVRGVRRGALPRTARPARRRAPHAQPPRRGSRRRSTSSRVAASPTPTTSATSSRAATTSAVRPTIP